MHLLLYFEQFIYITIIVNVCLIKNQINELNKLYLKKNKKNFKKKHFKKLKN